MAAVTRDDHSKLICTLTNHPTMPLTSTTRKSHPASEDKVFLGLQKKQQCKLCEQTFLVDSLPGAISHKSILMLRKSWGMNVNFLSPSLMYRQVKICVFCEQFFSSIKDANEENVARKSMSPQKRRGALRTAAKGNSLRSTQKSEKKEESTQ